MSRSFCSYEQMLGCHGIFRKFEERTRLAENHARTEALYYFVAKTLLGIWEFEEQGTAAAHLAGKFLWGTAVAR